MWWEVHDKSIDKKNRHHLKINYVQQLELNLFPAHVQNIVRTAEIRIPYVTPILITSFPFSP